MMTFAVLPSGPSDHLVQFTDQLRLAVAAYLARFKGASRYHTESDLRCYLGWCAEIGLDPLAARRPDLELYGLLGLRIFEATGADIADVGEEHGHRVLRVCGKGTTLRYDRARKNLDRHPNYILAAYMASGTCPGCSHSGHGQAERIARHCRIEHLGRVHAYAPDRMFIRNSTIACVGCGP